MFDHIYCRKKLPLCVLTKGLKVDWKNTEFQTKDLENIMDTYEITSRGRLRVKRIKWFVNAEEYYNDDSNEPEWTNSNYTGSVVFYTQVYSDNDYRHVNWEDITDDFIDGCEAIEYWVEFVAVFHKGKLEDLEWLKTDAHPVKEQLINQKKWYEERVAKDRLLHNRIKRVLRKVPGYKQFIQLLQKFVSLQSNLVDRMYF